MKSFDMIAIPPREEKPRKRGLTNVLDKGLGYYAALALVEQAAEYIDLVKLGWGTARLITEETIKKKIGLFTGNGVSVGNGGTFLEIAHRQGKVRDFFQTARRIGLNVIEVSNGVVPMGIEAKQKLISEARSMGFDVISEIGRKDPREDALLSVEERIEEAKRDMEAGASRIIIEAREGGKGLGRSGINALTAILRVPNGVLVENPAARALTRALSARAPAGITSSCGAR